ncbi:uncharacterized protein LOC144363019 [Saccoglossus kowalevskii]
METTSLENRSHVSSNSTNATLHVLHGILPVTENNPKKKTNNAILDGLLQRYEWFERKRFSPNYYLYEYDRSVDNDVNTTITSPMTYADYNLIFVHNQKSGGSTLKKCIERISVVKRLPQFIGMWDERVASNIAREISHKQSTRRIYVSENTFGLCDDFKRRPCSYFTLLRDPYERIISCHEFCKRALGDPLCAAGDARSMTLKEWALHQGSYFFRQLQFKPTEICSDKTYVDKIRPLIPKLKFSGRNRNFPPCWFRHKMLLDSAINTTEKEALLDYFISNLENWFSVIGITEEYDASLRLLQEVYGLPLHDMCSKLVVQKGVYRMGGKLVSPKSDEVKKLKEELQNDTQVQQSLYYDVKLYEKSREIFEKQKEKYWSIPRRKH